MSRSGPGCPGRRRRPCRPSGLGCPESPAGRPGSSRSPSRSSCRTGRTPAPGAGRPGEQPRYTLGVGVGVARPPSATPLATSASAATAAPIRPRVTRNRSSSEDSLSRINAPIATKRKSRGLSTGRPGGAWRYHHLGGRAGHRRRGFRPRCSARHRGAAARAGRRRLDRGAPAAEADVAVSLSRSTPRGREHLGRIDVHRPVGRE